MPSAGRRDREGASRAERGHEERRIPEGSEAAVFVRERPERLAKRRAAIEALGELRSAAERIKLNALDRKQVASALSRFGAVYAKLQPVSGRP